MGLALSSPRNAILSLWERGPFLPVLERGGGLDTQKTEPREREEHPAQVTASTSRGREWQATRQRGSALPEVHFPRSLPDVEPPQVTKVSGPRRTRCPPHKSAECLLCRRRVLGWTRVRTGLRGSHPGAPVPDQGR